MRLLCADDEEDIRTILELALSLDPEIEAELFPSGRGLLERAQTSDLTYDAFVLDGMMPDLDGYETCKLLKADPRTAATPVIFLTAKTHKEAQEDAARLGATAALPKPFDPMTLAADIRAVLGK